ncbi:hypothetical protein, partial [uncultured Parasutterella sp.]
ASKRFSDYVTLGQAANPTSELPVSANHLKGFAQDEGVRRNRWFVKQESGNASTEILQKKAIVLKDVKFGDSDTLTYKVQGWRQSNGELWKVNAWANVDDKWLETDRQLKWVIASITYTLNESGSIVSLELKQQQSFMIFKEVDTKKITIEMYPEIKKDSGRV